MKFALVNEQRQEAQPNLFGACPACGHPMLAKCGKVRIWHWAHKGGRTCDPWWENETEWHRAWKGHFPSEWQEVVHQGHNGEKHIADVKTNQGWVLEFQHSHIKPEERQSRDSFYSKLIWIVDGTRRKRDVTQFRDAWSQGTPVGRNTFLRKVFLDDCALLREWSDSRAAVFFDFGKDLNLFCLIANGKDKLGHVFCFSRGMLINLLRGGNMQDFEALLQDARASTTARGR